jgi:multicomponent Na+:H+ antiporter subunit F
MTTSTIAFIVLAVLVTGTLIRVALGPTVWDRLIGVGLIASKVTMGGVIVALVSGESYILDVALIFAVIGFLAQVLISRYIERRGDI